MIQSSLGLKAPEHLETPLGVWKEPFVQVVILGVLLHRFYPLCLPLLELASFARERA